MDERRKMACTIDALFGAGASGCMPESVRFTHYRTGRIREMYQDDILLCTLRTDGGLAVTVRFAQALLSNPGFAEYCMEVGDDAAPFVAEGRSVFARHVVRCGRQVRVAADTPVIHDGRVIAVGRALLSAEMMEGASRGVAVRVRDSLKRSGGAVEP